MHRSFVLGLLLIWSPTLAAQTSFPMITHVTPVAVQRGQTSTITVTGQMNFWGGYQTLVEGTGVTLSGLAKPEKVTPAILAVPPKVSSVKLTATVAADAALGVREFRIATALGMSSVGQILITDEPVTVEKLDNNTLPKAQPVTLPAVLTGTIESVEDVDAFRFTATKNETLTFQVYCARLQDKIHDLQKHADPLIALFDSTGRELALSDDAVFADPLLTFTIPADGVYTLMIRDAVYAGDPRWVYAIQATNRPVLTHIYPLACAPRSSVEIETVGSAKLIAPRVKFTTPTGLGLQSVNVPITAGQTSPATMLVTDLPIAMEQEPNDIIAQANRIRVPGGINGRIGQKRDLDMFTFAAIKGKPLRIQVSARRFGTLLNSGLDSVLELLDPTGKVLMRADDTIGKDAGLVFTPSTDGDYHLRIRDLHSKGGEMFPYWLQITEASPDFELKLDPAHTMIAPGGRTALYVTATRSDGFASPITVTVRNLPPGVTASPLTLNPNLMYGVIVLTANAELPLIATQMEVIGTGEFKDSTGKSTTLTRIAEPLEEIYLPGGGRGKFNVRMAAIGTTLSSDISDVSITSKPAIMGDRLILKPGDEIQLAVTVTRRPGFDKPLSLDIPLKHLGGTFANPLPLGVTIVEGKSKTLLGTGSVGTITLKVAADAPIMDDIPICVCAYVSINFVVKVGYASPALRLSIRK